MFKEDQLLPFLQRPADTLDALDRIDCEESLLAYVKRLWSTIEPSRPLITGWALDAVCEHLEAVSHGRIQKLLLNVWPGAMKSLLTEVFLPSWEWGPRNLPSTRYVSFSYSSSLTERDNRRFRDVMLSPDYQRLFGSRFALQKMGETLVSNNKTGWKLATSIGGVGTGERGDRILLDDPHNVKESESDSVRQETTRWFREAMSNRLNDAEKSAVIVIMQRVHDQDVSGVILSEMKDYEHLCIPFEWDGRPTISTIPEMKWHNDPRTVEGELAEPARMSPKVWRNLKITIGPYATASQYEQSPTPRGGGIFQESWWQHWDGEDGFGARRFPRCEFVVASLDGAFGQKQENDYTALTVWGVFKSSTEAAVVPKHYLEQALNAVKGDDRQKAVQRDVQRRYGVPKIILMQAWQKRLPLHGPEVEREPGESAADYRHRAMPSWGVVEWVADTCRRKNVNMLLVEAKANGVDVANEMRRLYSGEGWGVQLIDPGRLDKTARAYAVQPIFADHMVYAPTDLEWADMVIQQMKNFPKSTHDDLCDASVQAIKFLRDMGFAVHQHELERDVTEIMKHAAVSRPLYPA